MKRIITLCFVLAASVSLYAQQVNLTQFATLTHNDTVTGQWYGPTAFVSAHNAAVHGDIITLSPGTFNGTHITKALTIRGHGMFFDSIANTAPTIISGNFWIKIPDMSDYKLSIEGLFFSGNMGYWQIYSPSFKKCRFKGIYRVCPEYSGGNPYHPTLSLPSFTDCIILDWQGTDMVATATFSNCVILNVMTGVNSTMHPSDLRFYGYGYLCGQSDDVYYNCILNISPSDLDHKYGVVNCMVFSSDTTPSASTNITNTIGITDSTNYFATPSAGNNTNIQGFESIFKTFRGTYTEGETFELTPQAAATYLGSDNTQVGIYGGSTPFNPKATDSRIMKVSPAYSSNGNGQLPVTVQLRAQ